MKIKIKIKISKKTLIAVANALSTTSESNIKLQSKINEVLVQAVRDSNIK
ncbi:MAG: hypothetical protein RLZZ292_2426 [Bacteroidota bacterium]|jgi:hypothetical protein